jgi:hypothetical protein
VAEAYLRGNCGRRENEMGGSQKAGRKRLRINHPRATRRLRRG